MSNNENEAKWEEVLSFHGRIKDQSVTHHHDRIKFLTHTMCRVVMRNVNNDIREQLITLHQIIKNEFASMPPESIDWLLGGTHSGRGILKDSTRFLKFFMTDPHNISSSRLISALEAISTAIAYRGIDRSTGTHPVKPTHEHPAFLMYQKVHDMLDKGQQPYINNTYSARGLDELTNNAADLYQQAYVESTKDDVSDVSDAEDDDGKKPLHYLPSIRFKKYLNPTSNLLSWPAAARKGHIPIRANLSGTALIELAVFDSLFRRAGLDWFDKESNVRTFAGAVLLPTYERGDCHTVAETAGAVEYYIETRALRTPVARDPKACLELGLHSMRDATDETLRDAMSGACDTILANTQPIPALKSIDFEIGLEIIYNDPDPILMKSLAERMIHAINLSSDNEDEKYNKKLRLEEALKATPLHYMLL